MFFICKLKYCFYVIIKRKLKNFLQVNENVLMKRIERIISEMKKQQNGDLQLTYLANNNSFMSSANDTQMLDVESRNALSTTFTSSKLPPVKVEIEDSDNSIGRSFCSSGDKKTQTFTQTSTQTYERKQPKIASIFHKENARPTVAPSSVLSNTTANAILKTTSNKQENQVIILGDDDDWDEDIFD